MSARHRQSRNSAAQLDLVELVWVVVVARTETLIIDQLTALAFTG